MKFSLSWLKDHLETNASVDEIADALTRIGLEVEAVEDKSKALAPYVIAHVVSAEQHPNADRLRVCMVDYGAVTPIQVVCGAPNARSGMKSVFAPAGTYIPGKNITLAVGTIRGVESRGMLCSAFELEISEDHDGIIDLPTDAPVGAAFAEYAGLGDPVIEIGLTPNRPDCTSIHGIARDLAAVGLGTLKPGTIAPVAGCFPCPVPVTLAFSGEDAKLCPAFALRLVRGVRNGPSPEWLQRRLTAIGQRPINLLVDITNYLTFDRGRPLHVFDLKKVKGGLTVRRAREGETLLALDGRTYTFDDSTVVIADEVGVESIGGIMGGEASGCDEHTTDVLIESALWDPLNIAQTGRKLGIITDARYRFERGVDPAFCLAGLELATRLVVEHGGGEASEAIVAGKVPQPHKVISFPWNETKRLSGIEVSHAEQEGILKRLGFAIEGSGETVTVTVPTWRSDIDGKADLVEEVIRIVGLDRIAPQPLPRIESGVIKPVLTPIQKRTRLAKRTLATRGMVEAVTYSFISRADAGVFGGSAAELSLANPIAADMSDMRPSLMPGLIRAAQRNADRGFGDTALFEVGQCFASGEPEGQEIRACGLRRGLARPQVQGRDWREAADVADAFDAKADAVALLNALGVSIAGLQVVPGGPDWMHPGRSATLRFGPKGVIGYFGELHPTALKALDAKGPLSGFEIILDALPLPKVKPTKAKVRLVLSDFQPVSRDFAFVVVKDVAAGDLVKAVQGADKQLITSVNVFDVYEGTHLETGKKSLAVTVTLQPTDKTLTDVEIEAVCTKIVAEAARKTGAVLRA